VGDCSYLAQILFVESRVEKRFFENLQVFQGDDILST
jgi:hypothetical protein